MEKMDILAGFLALSGTFLIAGPLWMMARYHRRMNQMSTADLMDDEARHEGTALFITGGVVFWLAALILIGMRLWNKG